MRLVAVLPLDIETRTRAEVDLHRLRVCHDFKYRTARRTALLAQNLVKPPDRPNFTQLPDSIPNIFSGIRGIYLPEPVILVHRKCGADIPASRPERIRAKSPVCELSPLEAQF